VRLWLKITVIKRQSMAVKTVENIDFFKINKKYEILKISKLKRMAWWIKIRIVKYVSRWTNSALLNLTVWCSYVIPKENLRISGRIYATVTQAAAFTPPESKKKSTKSPSKKLKKIKTKRLFLIGYNKMNKT